MLGSGGSAGSGGGAGGAGGSGSGGGASGLALYNIIGYRAIWKIPGKGTILIKFTKSGRGYIKTFESLAFNDYSQMLDMLRNERPVYFNESAGNEIMTGNQDEWELVGEEET